MEVTKHNFNEKLENVLQAIQESSFIAIDGEFTGLSSSDALNGSPLDTPDERYKKIKSGASDFLLIQFGLCPFSYNEADQSYIAKPYNFYLFPTPLKKTHPDRRFSCQASSIDFLASHNFDFNKLFKEGIPYLTPVQEQLLQTELRQKFSEAAMKTPDSSRKSRVTVPEEHKEFVNNTSTIISEYMNSDKSEPLKLSPCNAFRRKLLYQYVGEKFPLAYVKTLNGEKKFERSVEITRKMNKEELESMVKQQEAAEAFELDTQVGFSKVIQALSSSDKLVVGHNMFLDVLHIINQFHCDLPQELEEYKVLVKTVLPRLLDTKLLANTQPLKDYISNSGLDNLRLVLQASPFKPMKVECASGFAKYTQGDKSYHEAGFDAFVTGSCFATMIEFLGSLQKPPKKFLSPNSPVLKPFINKLFLMKIVDIPYLNLDGPDLEPDRDHVFHVCFPKEWKRADLYQLFHPYGNIQICWLSDTSAFVSLYTKANKLQARKDLLKMDELSKARVITYDQYKQSHGREIQSTPSLTKRKLSNYDLQSPPYKLGRYGQKDKQQIYNTPKDESKSQLMFEESGQW